MFLSVTQNRFGFFGRSGRGKALKQARAAKRQAVKNSGVKDKVLSCSEELLTSWTEGHEKRNTQDLKVLCEENGIPRSGAKYEIIEAIEAHVQGYLRQQSLLSKTETAAGSNSSEERLEVQADLKICNRKTLEAAFNTAKKEAAKMASEGASSCPNKRFALLDGITSGLDHQIFTAVSGPSRARYNGKRGDLAIVANEWIAQQWLEFFRSHHHQMR